VSEAKGSIEKNEVTPALEDTGKALTNPPESTRTT
jgi:SspJ family small acid-soluble spore protein